MNGELKGCGKKQLCPNILRARFFPERWKNCIIICIWRNV